MNKDVIYPTMVIRSQAETIELQEKEIERLTAESTEWESKCYKYQDIINTLEKELEQEYAVAKANNIEQPNNPEWYIKWNCYLNILDKLKELKEGKQMKEKPKSEIITDPHGDTVFIDYD